MSNCKWLVLVLSCVVGSVQAVVKRHDVSETGYAVEDRPPYLVNMPHEGHGVLIHSQWIVTVAHTIFYDYVGKTLEIAGAPYTIDKVIVHPGYVNIPAELTAGNTQPLMNRLQQRHDIALIKLTSSVASGVQPLPVYSGSCPLGEVVLVYGAGAKGNGLTGEDLSSKSHRILERFENTINHCYEQWLTFTFDAPPAALPLEGALGSGDSGGPVIVNQQGAPHLAGLSSWQYWLGDIADFKGGLYGRQIYLVRITHYLDWIAQTLAEN